MNYTIWQYLFVFFLVASLVCVSATVILSVRYRLISLIRSDINVKKDKKIFENNMYSVDRIISRNNHYTSDLSEGIKQIDDSSKNNSFNRIADDTTELLQEADSSDYHTQITNNPCNTKTDDISSENTVIADTESTGTVIVNTNSLKCLKNHDFDSFIMVRDIKITNGKTSEIKKFR